MDHHHRPQLQQERGHRHGPLWQCIGPDITLVPVAAWATQISMTPEVARPSDASVVSGGCPDLDMYTALVGNRSHEIQLRPWLLLGHGPRHGPRQQPWPRIYH